MATLAFTVSRRAPELVRPAVQTPRETKRLSDLDDEETLRKHVPLAFFYRGRPSRAADDPAAVIRRALGHALVPYYPLAGRLREVEGRKLVVDCTGEGVMFAEADADVRLAELAAAGLTPPFPWMDQLLLDVEGSGGVLDCPLLLIQVTRLLCGGFVLTLRFSHVICDATGIAQFMVAVAELARGLPAPTVAPAWCRDLLQARTPPKPRFPHRVFDEITPPPSPRPPPSGDMITRTFTFDKADASAIMRGLPPKLRDAATTFEALTAALWRAWTAALEFSPDDDERLFIVVNFRGVPELALPAGYYGNATVSSAVATTAGALLAGTLGDAVELVRGAKAAVSAEYVRSVADLLVLRGRRHVAVANRFLVSDVRHVGFHGVDLGWGEPAYGGPTETVFGLGYVVRVGNGGDAVGVVVELPRPAMDRFASEVEVLLKG